MEETKLVIFDVDGTLLDSEKDITDAMNKMLAHRGYPLITSEEMRTFLGESTEGVTRLSLKKDVGEEEFKKCVDEYVSNYMGGGSPKTKPYAGIAEAISEIKARGYKVAVLSNKPQVEIDRIKDRLIVPLGIEEIVGASSQIPLKPDPYGAKCVMEKHGAKPENTFFVGDGETDVMTALNGGMKCVAVLWGNRDREFLSKFGATVFAEKPADLLDIIK